MLPEEGPAVECKPVCREHPKSRRRSVTQSSKPKVLEPEMDDKAKGSAGLTVSGACSEEIGCRERRSRDRGSTTATADRGQSGFCFPEDLGVHE